MESLDLSAPAEKAIQLLRGLNLDFYDVVAVYSKTIRINIFGRSIKEAISKVNVGLGVRVFKNKGLGVAYSQSLDERDIEETVKKAAKYARVAQPDPYFKGLPGPVKAQEVSGLCDKEIINLTLEDASKIPRDMVDACESVRRGGMYYGEFSANYSKFCLLVSTGIDIESEKTVASAYIQPVYRNGDDVGSSYEFDYSVCLSNIDPYWIGRKAAEKAIEQFGSRKIKSGVLPLILLPEASSTLFRNMLSALSGERAVKGRTFASNLLGKQIAPENLKIIDDGTIPGAVASSTYDGEGVPKRLVKVIENGTVLTFLHNSYSAGIMNIESTGHAIRNGYRGNIDAGPSNIRVKPGDCTLDEIIKETKKGILVANASFTPNIVSGEISTTIDEGFLIENGEKVFPVKNLMIGGHILEFLKNIDLISKEGRVFGGGHFFPAIRVREAKISGE
ncbi:MAG: TldD/PmbA family protein [Candidatus Bathyarchaeia archaeon]|nr:TldD/PmbA family protein [Candidatus Bathyarchaeota archaeon]